MVSVSEHGAGGDTAVVLPEIFSEGWAIEFAKQLDGATRRSTPLKQVLPPETAALLFSAATRLLIKEPTLLEVRPGCGRRRNAACRIAASDVGQSA